METITYTQVQQLVEKLPETKLPLVYHFFFFFSERDIDANRAFPINDKRLYQLPLSNCYLHYSVFFGGFYSGTVVWTVSVGFGSCFQGCLYFF